MTQMTPATNVHDYAVTIATAIWEHLDREFDFDFIGLDKDEFLGHILDILQEMLESGVTPAL